MKLIYMGTPDFAVEALQALKAAGHEITYVVTQPDAMRDRGKKVKFSPVKEKAIELGIPVLQPEKIRKNEEFLNRVKQAEPDAIVVAAYGKLLPEELLNIPKYGCLNIHGSLLPRFRGAAPIQAAIIAGDEETGVTIMVMEKGLDTGDMLAKASTPIGKKTGEQIHDELAQMGAELIVSTLKKIESDIQACEGSIGDDVLGEGSVTGRVGGLIAEKQDDALSTYAPMISKEDGHIDFNLEPEEIERRIRAFDPWPGSFAKLEGKTFKFWKAESVRMTECVPGSAERAESVQCADNQTASRLGADNTVSVDDRSNRCDMVATRLGEGPVPGTILAVSDQGIDIAAGQYGTGILRVTEIQAPGKKRIPVKDYLRGNTIVIGAVLR